MERLKLVRAVFCALVGVFAMILGQFFVPGVGEFFEGGLLFLLPFLAFSFLGVVLVFVTLKSGVKGRLRKFLLLTGASSAGFFVGVLLHNFFYGLGIIVGHIALLKYLMEALHVIFFIIAVVVCPIGFLIGAVGSATLFVRRRKKKNSSLHRS